MKIIVDTNIVFSAVLKSKSEIANILLKKSNNIDFYSANFLKYEINNNLEKLIRISGIDKHRIVNKINFID